MGFSICNLLPFLLMCTDSASSQVHFYITPSPNVHCSRDPCLTLSQLAANSISYLCNETNLSLSFQPGNHSLEGELSLSQADNFSMTKDKGGNGTVFVECGSQSERINISETTFTMIKDLHFIGCGGNRVSQVEQKIILLGYRTLDWIHKKSRNRISYVRLDHTLYSNNYGNIIEFVSLFVLYHFYCNTDMAGN